VTSGGDLYASSANISGHITAETLSLTDSCTIGGWYVNETSLYNNGVYLNGSTGTISGSSISGSTVSGSSIEG
jgi:hypothetical protein